MRQLGTFCMLGSLLLSQTGCQMSVGMSPAVSKLPQGAGFCPHCGAPLEEGRRFAGPHRPKWSSMEQQGPPGMQGPDPESGYGPMPPALYGKRGGPMPQEGGFAMQPGPNLPYPQGPQPRMVPNSSAVVPTLPPNMAAGMPNSRQWSGQEMMGGAPSPQMMGNTQAPRQLPMNMGSGEGPYDPR